MSTVAVVADRIRRRIHAVVAVGSTTVLTEDLDTSETQIDVTADVAERELPDLVPGAILEVDSELMLVTALEGSNTLVVARGVQGSTAATHATAARVWVAPVFSLVDIADHMAAEIRSWPRSIYRAVALDLDWPASTRAVDLLGVPTGVDVRGIADTMRSATDSAGGYRRPAVRLVRDAPTTEFASGYAVQLVDPSWNYGETVDVRVVVGVGFDTDPFTSSTDLVATVGLSLELEDLLEWGVGVRLLTELLSHRALLDRQGSSRVAEQDDSRTIATAIEAWRRIRDERRDAEIQRLQSRYGVRM